MYTISITYTLKWQLKNNTHYKVSKCKRMFNCKSGKEIKQVYQKGSIGYCISGKFKSLKELRNQIELIPKKEILPF